MIPGNGLDRNSAFASQVKTGMRITNMIHVYLYRLTGGRIMGRLNGAPVLLLTTIGSRTHQRRTRPLVYLADGDTCFVVGSMGGAPSDPAWVHNLRAYPYVLVERGSQRQEMRAEIVPDAERQRVWPRLVALFPPFAEYQRHTTRTLPVIALRPQTTD